MTSTRGILCLALLIAGVSLIAAGQGTFELKRTVVDSDHPFASRYVAIIGSVTQEYPEITRKPEGMSDNAVYLILELMGKTVYFILECDPGKPVLWADTDLDGDLAEEKPIQGQKRDSFPKFDFGTIDLIIPSGEEKLELVLGVRGEVGEDRGTIYLSQRQASCAVVEVGGKKVRIEIADTDFDGRCNSFHDITVTGRRDALCHTGIDSESGTPEEPIAQSLSRVVRIGDGYYDLKLSDDGDSLTISETSGQYGVLDVGSPSMRARLVSDRGEFIMTPNDEGRWKLPTGTYSTMRVTLYGGDDKSKTLPWNYGASKLSAFVIEAGKTTSIPAGEPLHIATGVKVSGGAVEISLSITGQAGESYSAGVYNEGKQNPAPGFKALDEDGNVVVTGTFAYG